MFYTIPVLTHDLISCLAKGDFYGSIFRLLICSGIVLLSLLGIMQHGDILRPNCQSIGLTMISVIYKLVSFKKKKKEEEARRGQHRYFQIVYRL